MKKVLTVTLCSFLLLGFRMALGQIYTLQKAEKTLSLYREELASLRKEYPKKRNLPEAKFFFFGMGNRPKLLYRDGKLIDLKTQKSLRRWKVKMALIVPSEYWVHLELQDGKTVDLVEDATGVYAYENGLQLVFAESSLNLPSFSASRFPLISKVLHHEILMNIDEGKPLPNFLVYQKPWYRTAAMMTMALAKTDNLDQIADWIKNLNSPFDRNNNGYAEADNLGEVLYMLGAVSAKGHPLINKILDEADNFDKGGYIAGRTDMALHPVYQTKWLKYGLKALGLPDKYKIPSIPDSYGTLFWWEYRQEYVAGATLDNTIGMNAPHFMWASDHFFKQNNGMISLREYPLTWEAESPEAKYSNLSIVNTIWADVKVSPMNAWQASEMLLLLNP